MTLSKELENATEDMLREIIRQAEIYIQTQVSSALQSDARAMGFGSVMATFAAGSVAAVVAIVQSSQRSDLAAATLSLAVFSVFAFISMILAFRAAEPIDFSFPGNDPAQWVDDIRNSSSIQSSLAQTAEHYSSAIDENNKRMEGNSNLLRTGIRIFFAGALLGVTPLVYEFVRSVHF